MSTELSLSINIKKYRTKLGLSQQDLAVKAKIPISIITKIEQRVTTRPEIQTIIKIADALSVSIDTLIGRKKQ